MISRRDGGAGRKEFLNRKGRQVRVCEGLEDSKIGEMEEDRRIPYARS